MTRETALAFVPFSRGLPGFEPRHIAWLRENATMFDWIECRTREEFLEHLPRASAVISWVFQPEWQDIAPKLRFIGTPSAGRDLVVTRPDPDLTVTYSAFHGPLMAETVLGMMLAFLRGIKECVEHPGEVWPRAEVGERVRHLRGSHVAILGFGHIGKWVGKLIKSFGVRLTGVNRSNLERPEYFQADDRVVGLDALDEILPEADHLIMVLPSDSGTDNIIGARRLALLRPDAYIYNIGRGNALDLPALVEALKAGRLAGAGLDVFPQEPLPADSPIIGCPRVIRLPHVSAFGPLYMDLYLEELLPKLEGKFGRH